MDTLKRRNFLKKTTWAAIGSSTVLAACKQEHAQPNTQKANKSDKIFRWKMVTTWPPHFPVLGENVDKFAKLVEKMSEGRIQIQVYGAGELIPANEVFDAVSLGAVELGHSAPYYWAGRVQASQFFASIPFGMNSQQMIAWIIAGGGLQLWREVYAPFNIVPYLGGCTGMQMGGWFNREIKSLTDFKGLIMRIPGLGGKVVKKIGGSPITVAGAEIYTNLERGVIDACEWIGPFHDYLLGLHRVAKYYYYPGWQEPGTPLEVLVNKNALQSLPEDLQMMLESAIMQLHTTLFAESEAKNAEYLDKLIQEEKKELRKFPSDVLAAMNEKLIEVIQEMIATDPISKKVYESYENFRQRAIRYSQVTEQSFYGDLQSVKSALSSA
ncbi:MAG: TRAP transporter substrate-binding protein [Cytophagales bacterium]|nr:TRAP transporter substrate-binding protein [Bernardetiaceae bacterium]MDW8203658.1 TRAP transporter substrate-binding protein [Cytophagales bacterium]